MTVLAITLGVAGCSSDDGESSTPTTTTAALPSSTLVFRPVAEVLPADACDEPENDLFPATDTRGSIACYRLGAAPVDRVIVVSAGIAPNWPTCFEGDPPSCADINEPWLIEPVLEDSANGIGALNTLAEPCLIRAEDCPTGQVAIVIDGEVVSAPTIEAPSFEPDQIVIAGDFTEQEAQALADGLV